MVDASALLERSLPPVALLRLGAISGRGSAYWLGSGKLTLTRWRPGGAGIRRKYLRTGAACEPLSVDPSAACDAEALVGPLYWIRLWATLPLPR